MFHFFHERLASQDLSTAQTLAQQADGPCSIHGPILKNIPESYNSNSNMVISIRIIIEFGSNWKIEIGHFQAPKTVSIFVMSIHPILDDVRNERSQCTHFVFSAIEKQE